MGLTDAERQRRSRSHRVGDHSLCDPERCNDAVTRGQKLYREVSPGLGPESLVLLEEAGRIVDRLDRLDAILTGQRREWMHFRTQMNGDVRVILTGALSEAREQATTLRGLIAEITKARSTKPAGKSGRLFGAADELAPRRRTRT